MRFAIVSDIHSNWQALQAVVADMPDVDEVDGLGDVVGDGADPHGGWEETARGNLGDVIPNGTAVLGLGPIGPLAAKPVMEGKG